MHLVQAIDGVPECRAVLCLFEGVRTGAADGYARLAGGPAATLLHLGAGIHHVPYDAPLTSDIEAVAKPVSAWIRTSRTAEGLTPDGRRCRERGAGTTPQPARWHCDTHRAGGIARGVRAVRCPASRPTRP